VLAGTRRQQIMIDLVRRLASERRVRSCLLEPLRKKHKLPVERPAAKQREDPARAFVLETQDESFNERDIPVLTNGAEARCDSLAITPILEHDAPGLLALVTRDIFRRSIGGMSSAFEELRNDQF